MIAARFVGRVGGLATALGVGILGVGVATGTGVPAAVAEGTSGGGAGSARQETADAGPSRGTSRRVPGHPLSAAARGSARPRPSAAAGRRSHSNLVARSAASASVQADPTPAVPVHARAVTAPPAPLHFPGVAVRPTDPPAQPIADRTPVYPPPVVAAAAGSVTSMGPGVRADPLDPLTGQTPAGPAESALAWATLAISRRQSDGPRAGKIAQATGSLLGNSITVDPQVQWTDGLLLGSLNATSGRGLPMSYSVVRKPSLGGKVAWAPDADGTSQDLFSYLPPMSTLTTPGQREEFGVLVSEITPFDTFLRSIPVIGGLWNPVLKVLHRLPILSTVLAPLIGDAVVATFDETPSVLAAGRPVAFTYPMPSFDGTLISVNYYPATAVAEGDIASAPTVLNGPDLGFPGNTNVFSTWAPSLVDIVPGIPVLRSGASPFDGGYAASTGFNVITWDPRGEWASGGVLQLDSPFYEGRDVSSIISWAASQANIAQHQVATNAGDPLIGMVGGSYGGGIQLTSAAIDPRIDAIVPGIAWNTLNESLYPDNRFKTVIGTELLLALVGTRARINSQIYPAIITGDLFSWLSQSEQALLTNAGPGILAQNITAPSLFLQGTVDILFELDAANNNAELMLERDPSLPVKITWFCGGHGVCLLPVEDQQVQGAANMNDTLRWLDQYAAGNASAGTNTIPSFQWYDQNGTYHSSELLPFDPLFTNPVKLSYSGAGGSLLLVPLLGGSGPSEAAVPPAKRTLFSTAFSLASGGRARNALNLTISPPVGTLIAGAPSLSFSYRGLGTGRAVYAQLVDNASGQVVGNIVTPVTVTLDGRQRTVTIPMADIAYTVTDPGDSMTLQITSSALPYADMFAWGLVNITDVKLELPTVA